MGIFRTGERLDSGGVSSHNIGDIFFTTRTDNSLNGAVECNGSQYSFADISGIKGLLDRGNIPSVTISEYNNQVSTNGSCGVFGYRDSTEMSLCAWDCPYNISNIPDTLYTEQSIPEVGDIVYSYENNVLSQIGTVQVLQNNTTIRIAFSSMEIAGFTRNTGSDTTITIVSETDYFKVPTINSVYIKADGSNIGNYLPAGLPNITATLPADDYNTYGWAGAFYEGSTVNPATRHLESMPGQYHPVYFDASRVNRIYGNSDTVQPESICLRPMVQLFNASSNEATAVCASVLAGDYIVYWDSYDSPDHSHAYPGITLEANQWYRIYKSGWCEQGGIANGAGASSVYTTLNLIITMRDKNYKFLATYCLSGYDKNQHAVFCIRREKYSENDTASQAILCCTFSVVDQNGYTGHRFEWEVKGWSSIIP